MKQLTMLLYFLSAKQTLSNHIYIRQFLHGQFAILPEQFYGIAYIILALIYRLAWKQCTPCFYRLTFMPQCSCHTPLCFGALYRNPLTRGKGRKDIINQARLCPLLRGKEGGCKRFLRLDVAQTSLYWFYLQRFSRTLPKFVCEVSFVGVIYFYPWQPCLTGQTFTARIMGRH